MTGARYFGAVSWVTDDGACTIRRLDGLGIVPLDARDARQLGELRAGQRLEFSLVEDRAVDVDVLDLARRLPAIAS